MVAGRRIKWHCHIILRPGLTTTTLRCIIKNWQLRRRSWTSPAGEACLTPFKSYNILPPHLGRPAQRTASSLRDQQVAVSIFLGDVFHIGFVVFFSFFSTWALASLLKCDFLPSWSDLALKHSLDSFPFSSYSCMHPFKVIQLCFSSKWIVHGKIIQLTLLPLLSNHLFALALSSRWICFSLCGKIIQFTQLAIQPSLCFQVILRWTPEFRRQHCSWPVLAQVIQFISLSS